MQMMFGPAIVAPMLRALGSIAPLAAEAMLTGLDQNKILWERLAGSENCSPVSVLADADGTERVLHVYGGSLLEGDSDPDVCMCVLCIILSNVLEIFRTH